MAKLNREQIRDLARKIVLSREASGIRYGELRRAVQEQHSETPLSSVGAAMWDLDKTFSEEIAKPSRGLFVAVKYVGNVAQGNSPPPTNDGVSPTGAKEQDFYEPFAQWLCHDLDEVTDAVALGGAALGNKWGTPDVVGVYRSRTEDLIKFDAEIVSAEIKVNPSQPVVAFGQATAYRLFSTKSYVVMPKTLTEDDKSRLEALCMLYGIGLVLFDPDRKDDPEFLIKVRAQRFSPDMFYVNEFAKAIQKHDQAKFHKLFS